MAGPEFFQTRMGQVFYEGTMPALVRELTKLNATLDRLVAVAERDQEIVNGPLTVPKTVGKDFCKLCGHDLVLSNQCCSEPTCFYATHKQYEPVPEE